MSLDAPAPSWTLLSSHGQVLACLARDPTSRLRDVAVATGLTERAVQKLILDLERAALVTRRRVGRRNRYRLHGDRGIEVPAGRAVTLGSLLGALVPPAAGA